MVIIMEHLSYIKASQTWTCPKTGVYKIIAVGGGSGAAYALSTASFSEINGGTTSFGSYVSAAGGQAVETVCVTNTNAENSESYESYELPFGAGYYSGEGGYTLTQYCGAGECAGENGYRPPAGNGGVFGGQGRGYGASGGFYAHKKYDNSKGYTGKAGEISLAILEFSAGDKVSVTVGNGGTVPEPVTNCFNLEGRAGVVIVEYLGTFDLS